MSHNDEDNDFLERAANHNSKKKLSTGDWLIRILIGLIVYGAVREAIHFAASNRNEWSSENTKYVYNSLKAGLSKTTIDSLSKKSLVNCVIGKLKITYPQGLSTVNGDSLKHSTQKFMSACAIEVNINLGWSPMVDSVLRARLLETTLIRYLPDTYKKPFCDCYISKIKELYPNGLTESLRQSTRDSISTFCSKKVIK